MFPLKNLAHKGLIKSHCYLRQTYLSSEQRGLLMVRCTETGIHFSWWKMQETLDHGQMWQHIHLLFPENQRWFVDLLCAEVFWRNRKLDLNLGSYHDTAKSVFILGARIHLSYVVNTMTVIDLARSQSISSNYIDSSARSWNIPASALYNMHFSISHS